MEKLDGTSMNLVQENIKKLKEIFPEIFIEGRIDFDLLRQICHGCALPSPTPWWKRSRSPCPSAWPRNSWRPCAPRRAARSWCSPAAPARARPPSSTPSSACSPRSRPRSCWPRPRAAPPSA